MPSGPAGWPSVVLMKMDQNPTLGSAGATPLMVARNPVVGAKVKPAAAPAAAMVVWVPMAQPTSTASLPGAKSTATVTPVPGAHACPVTVAGGAAAAGVAPVSSVVATSSRPAATVASVRRWSGTWRFFTGTFFVRGTNAAPVDHQDSHTGRSPSVPVKRRDRLVRRAFPFQHQGIGTVRPAALRAPPCIPRQRELHHVQRVSGLRRSPDGTTRRSRLRVSAGIAPASSW